MRLRVQTSVLAGLLLAGCVHDQARPVDPLGFPTAFAARRLDDKPVGAVWSGPDLLAAALARNPTVAEAEARYRTALAAAKAARVRPSIGLTLTAEYANESPRWGAGGALDIPLDQGGRRTTRLTTADLAALQAFYDYGEAIWATRTAVEKARASLLLADEQLELATRAVALRRDRFDRLSRRVAAGEDARPASLLAQTELIAAERRLADLRSQREQARLALAKAVGVEPAETRALVIKPIDAIFDPAALPTWRGEAAASRRDVLRAVADYDLAEAALRLEIAKQYPELRLSPGYNYDHGVNKLPFSISLVLPPADLNRAAIAQAEAKRAEAGRALETVQANALAAVDQAKATLDAAQDQARRAEGQDLPTARRTAVGARASAQAGETDRTDQLAAEAAELDAEIALADARRATAIALVDLEDALRRPVDPAEAAVIEAALKRIGDPK